jgi:predicted esterase
MTQSPFKRITKGKDIELLPKSGKYDYVYIFMHGLFTSPSKYIDFFDTADSPIPSNFKVIMPCAPVQSADFNQGRPTTSWFNISTKYGGVIYEDTINYKQLEESSNRIKEIINKEAELLNNDYSRIFVSGFSQGSFLSYYVGLSFEYLLGGIACFCGFPLSKTKFVENNRKNLNIFAVFGAKDQFVEIEFSKGQIKKLLGKNENIVVKEYKNYDHQVYEEELEDMKKFILGIINK